MNVKQTEIPQTYFLIHNLLFLEIKIPPKTIKPPPATVEIVRGSWKNIIPTIDAKKR